MIKEYDHFKTLNNYAKRFIKGRESYRITNIVLAHDTNCMLRTDNGLKEVPIQSILDGVEEGKFFITNPSVLINWFRSRT